MIKCKKFVSCLMQYSKKYGQWPETYTTPQLKKFSIIAMAFSPHSFKILPTFRMEFCLGDRQKPTINTIISNITVLESHNVICSGCFMSMSQGANKKASPIVFPPPLPFTRFSPCLLVVLQEILYLPSFTLVRLLWKIMHF